ncbi:MAG: glycosyltransferase [Gemmatimonadota bacterium]|nr:glycosyltransferase [Gemmatimonadota bacterium]
MTERAPLVSVLMPVRDARPFLDEATASISMQTFRDFEVIVVDDGSVDGSATLLERWASADARVRVMRQPPTGIVAALERARSSARGRFLARMDADDVMAPTRLEAQRALMEAEPGLMGCGCLIRYFPRDLVRDGARRYERWINAQVTPDQIEEALFVECPLAHPSFFLRARAVQSVGGYRACSGPEDYDLILRMWRAGARFGKVPEVLHHWRERPDRLSRVDARYSAEAFLATKVGHLTATLLVGGRPVVIWGAGPVGKALSKALRQSGVPLTAFAELDPRKIGQEIHGAPVLDTAEAVALRGPLHVAAVGQSGARARIRAVLDAAGMTAMEDFVAVA